MDDDGGVGRELCSTHEEEPEVLESQGKNRSIAVVFSNTHACVRAVVSQNEAFTQAVLRCHHCYCISSAGRWRSRGGRSQVCHLLLRQSGYHLWRAYQEVTGHLVMILIPEALIIDGTLTVMPPQLALKAAN